MDEHAFVAGLERAVGTEFVVTHPHAKRTYESDGLLQYAVTPRAVVLAGSTEEVQRVVKPYLKQCAPPEFSATLPPIEQTICDDGSGG